MKTTARLAILIALACPVTAHAEKDVSDAELHAIGSAWKRRCSDLAVAENQPALEKACINGFLEGLKEMDAMREDPTVSERMWDVCKAESGFNYTNDFHAWAACMRIARTRPGLRDY